MPWSGGSFTRTNGVNTGATLWAQDRDDGTKILATRHDTNDQDMADGINSTLEKSGSNAATGNLDIGSNRITLVADGTAKTDVATVNQIQSNGPAFQATDTGTANTYVIALTPAITAYAAGQEFTFKAGAASTTASTLNVNTLGAKALKKLHDQDIASGDIETGSIVTAVYDGTNFQVTSQLATAPADSGSAYAGVLEANANFNDQVIFGPSVDGRNWNGAWSKASLFSSLMLCTVETSGSDTQVNIWDLTEQSAGAISTTPLGTVTISGVTPRAVDAAMGYIIIATDGGGKMVDPHSGAWVQRTAGWPKSLSTATAPALTNSDIQAVAAGFSDQPAFDPRTGGPMPTFVLQYGTGADISALVKDDGSVYNRAGTVGNKGVAITNGRVINADNDSADGLRASDLPISTITADDWGTLRVLRVDGGPFGFIADTTFDANGSQGASASTNGATLMLMNLLDGSNVGANALVNRTYNTGYLVGDIRGAWLANSATVDRSYKGNTLTNNGSAVTEAAVETSSELLGYSGFTASNNLSRASDADWDVIGTGSVYLSCWFKVSGGAQKYFINFGNSGATVECILLMDGSGRVEGRDDGATAQVYLQAAGDLRDSTWHKGDFVRVSSTERYLYVDGVLKDSSTTDAGSLSDSGNLPLYIGVLAADGSSGPASSSELSLAKISATAPSATQVRQMYDAEKPMFVASAECLLQSSSTDAVLDVDVDPLTSKVLVTQTDAITIFDGLAIDSKPTVNSGTSEKGQLWGALRAEQNSANTYVTAPAVDQRQVNEMVRGLASDLPAGVDLGKAKAWVRQTSNSSTVTIGGSYNVASITRTATGVYTVVFAIPFKQKQSYAYVTAGNSYGIAIAENGSTTKDTIAVSTYHHDGVAYDSAFSVIAYGELENE